MDRTEDILDKLLYLDPDYISSKYEEIKKVSPTTQFSRTEGRKGEAGIPSVLKADIHSQETRTFSLSSIQMLKDIYDDLALMRDFRQKEFQNYQGTQTGWIKGELTLGEWVSPRVPESSSFKQFEIKSDGIGYSLIIQPQNFSSNIGALLTASAALRANIGVPIKALVRVLFLVEDIPSFVTCPYLILEP